MEIEREKPTKMTAVAVVGTVFTGVLGWAGALFAFFNVDATGFGVSLVASALAFGLLARAALRP